MKVFATLATILGASTANPLFQNQHSMNSVLKPSMDISMDSQMTQHDSIDRHMDTNNQMSNVRDMYRNNQDMNSHIMKHNIMGQEMSLNMRDMQRQNQAIGFTAPNQYFVKDDFGNYVYSYNDQQSEKSEEGNNQSIKGQYAYIMSNGVKRRVEYIADNKGFHIIRDNADPARIKRSTEPDLLQARMTSTMDSSSLRNDAHDMYRMSTLMGRDMSSNTDTNLMGMEQHKYPNIIDRDSLNHNLMAQDTMGNNMMGRDIYNIMSNRGLTSDISNTMGQKMHSNIMGQDMTMNAMSRHIMGQDKNSKMMRRTMLGHRDMSPNIMYSNMMGKDMINMSNNHMSSNMMNSRRMSSDSLSNNGLTGQHMMTKTEIEHVPETYTSTRFF